MLFRKCLPLEMLPAGWAWKQSRGKSASLFILPPCWGSSEILTYPFGSRLPSESPLLLTLCSSVSPVYSIRVRTLVMARMVKSLLEKYEEVSLITTTYVDVSCACNGNPEEMEK